MTDIRIVFRRDLAGLRVLVRLRDAGTIRFRVLRLPPATTMEEAYEQALTFALARVAGCASVQGRLC